MQTRDWDGRTYDRISGTMEALGLEVLDRLPLTGEESVLDAGCGSGRITQVLIERLPRGRVIGVDQNESMVAAARERLPAGTDLRVMDLLDLDLGEQVDAILSTATFHWIPDHERLFERLHAALRPGGRLLAQCGGAGNIDILRSRARVVTEREPFAAHFASFVAPWNYAAADVTRERLLAAGFQQAEAWLVPAPRQPEEPRAFLSAIVLGPHVQHLPEELRDPFMDQVMDVLEKPITVDYVRLNIDAVA